MLRNQVAGAWQSNPIIVDGIMYVIQRPNDVTALDRINTKPPWNVEVGDVNLACSVTMAPLAVKDKVIVGVGGREGYIHALDAQSGELL